MNGVILKCVLYKEYHNEKYSKLLIWFFKYNSNRFRKRKRYKLTPTQP